MKIKGEDLWELYCGGSFDQYEVVLKQITDHSRWSVSYTLVIKIADRYWQGYVRVPATEQQDHDIAEWETLVEVFATKETITVYKKECEVTVFDEKTTQPESKSSGG